MVLCVRAILMGARAEFLFFLPQASDRRHKTSKDKMNESLPFATIPSGVNIHRPAIPTNIVHSCLLHHFRPRAFSTKKMELDGADGRVLLAHGNMIVKEPPHMSTLSGGNAASRVLDLMRNLGK
jgi:hypothetical protein